MNTEFSAKEITAGAEGFKILAETIPQLVWTALPSGNIDWINRNWSDYTGMSMEVSAGSGWSWTKAVAPEDADEAVRTWKEAMREGTVYEAVCRLGRADGIYRWFLVKAKPARENDQVVKWFGTCTDIHEQRTGSERKLVEHENLLEKISDFAPCIINVSDVIENKFVYSNKETYRILGITEAELHGKGHAIMHFLVFPEDIDTVLHTYKLIRSVSDDEALTMMYRIRTAERGTRWIKSRLTVFKRNAAGEVLQVISVGMDITERKEVERRLEESQHFIARIADSTPDIIQIYDLAEKRNVYVNKEVYNLLGYTFEDFKEMGTSYMKELVHPEDLSIVLERNEKFKNIMDGETLETIHRVRHKNGEWRWMQSRGVVFKRSETGEVLQYLSLVRDITERKEAEEKLKEAGKKLQHLNEALEQRIEERTSELRQSEANLKEAQRISKLGHWNYDLQSSRIQWSEEIFLIHGMDPSEKEPDYETLLSYYVNPELLRVHVGRAVTEGIPYQYDAEIRLKDGTHKIMQVIGHPVMDAEGKCVRLYGTCIDITERKEAEEAIKRSERQLYMITDTLPVLVAYVDHTERYRFVNQGYCRWFGEDAKERFRDQSVQEILPDFLYQKIRPHMEKVLQGIPAEYESDLTDIHGIHHFIHARYIPDLAEDGKVRGFIALILDVTEIRKNQETLERINNELVHKNEELLRINNDLDNFIYMASHDLKAPVSNIEGLIHALVDSLDERSTDGGVVKRILDMVYGSIERFKKTLRDLTEISKIQRNVQEGAAEDINVESMIDDIRSMIREDILASGTSISVDTSRLPVLRFARKDLHSILYNLLSNAIKYRSPERAPQIEVSVSEKDGFGIVSVRDNGLGIPSDKKEQVFTMFKRLHDHVEGTGIGLYIVKRMMDNAGGRIEVESEEGKGSVFHVYCPIR